MKHEIVKGVTKMKINESILKELEANWNTIIKEIELNIIDFAEEDMEIKYQIINMMKGNISSKITEIQIQVDLLLRLLPDWRTITNKDVDDLQYVYSILLDSFLQHQVPQYDMKKFYIA